MGSRMEWVLLVMTVVLEYNYKWCCSLGCLVEERNALLKIKANINYPYGSSLPSWREEVTADCCQWEGVECNSTTRRVGTIDLSFSRMSRLGKWYLNASLFLPFEQLNTLDLGYNLLAGWVENEGFERLSILNSLETIGLSTNYFDNDILLPLSKLSSLKYLHLSHNVIKGSINFHGGFANLNTLYLSGNNIQDFKGNRDLGGASMLCNLQELHLYGNKFNNRTIKSLRRLERLKFLDLSDNELHGTIQISGDFVNLSTLDLSYNNIQSFEGNRGGASILRNLEELHLQNNQFNNSTVKSLNGLERLKFLDLSNNQLQGTIQIGGDFVNLNTLNLSNNSIQSFEENTGGASILRNLEELHLQSNQFNNSTVKSLNGLERLKFLDLSRNQLQGTVEIDDLEILNNLEELDLSRNNISGFTKVQGSKRITQIKFLNLDYMSSENASDLLQSLGRCFTLKRLSFRGSNAEVTITSQWLRNLTNLEVLILDYSNVNKGFLQNIQVVTSLKALSLEYCGLGGSPPNQGWCELRNLKELSFAKNHLTGILPPCMGNLTSLQVLDIGDNQLTGNIGLSPLSTLTSLQWLLFSNNQFEVPLSLKSFSNHSYLKVLVGSNNKLIVDPILNTSPSLKLQLEVVAFQNCLLTHIDVAPTNFLYFQSHLKGLDLSHNNISGPFPSWLLENSSRLERFYLRNNTFGGPLELPSHPLYRISDIDISYNDFGGHIPANISSVFPKLYLLDMSSNRFEGNHLYHFSNMSYLSILDLSNNQLSGILKEHLAMHCPSLYIFKLSNNILSGNIPPSFFTNLLGIQYLFLDGNHFNGEIPSSISLMDLQVLNISNNQFTGRIPKWLGNQPPLRAILIFKNYLQGPIPTELCKLDQLELLDLSENNLSGSIPTCFGTSNILHLHADKNKLGGPLPQSLFNSSSMVTLDLRENYFSGSIPSWISNVSTLRFLLLRANNLTGNISHQLCHLRQLSILDLSQNFLSGRIPPCLGNMVFKAITHINIFRLGFNVQSSLSITFTGILNLNLEGSLESPRFSLIDMQEEVKFDTKNRYESYKGEILRFMGGIDLSCNQLTDGLPLEIGNLSEIRALNFSYNQLNGSIPIEFSNLRMLESLDLSYNNLTGVIPPQFVELTSLEVFSVAHNNLSGKTPERKGQFGTFEESSYEGNPYLCRIPLKKSCWETKPTWSLPSPQQEEEEDTKFIHMATFKTSFIGSYITILFGIFAILYLNPYWRRTWFYLVEMCITTIYYFFVDNFGRLYRFKRM